MHIANYGLLLEGWEEEISKIREALTKREKEREGIRNHSLVYGVVHHLTVTDNVYKEYLRRYSTRPAKQVLEDRARLVRREIGCFSRSITICN